MLTLAVLTHNGYQLPVWVTFAETLRPHLDAVDEAQCELFVEPLGVVPPDRLLSLALPTVRPHVGQLLYFARELHQLLELRPVPLRCLLVLALRR